MINGEVCLNLGTIVGDEDQVVVNGKKVRPNKGMVIVLHKPRGFVCTRRDEYDRETMYALLPEKFSILHHVGRLDKESEGLILLTNQGDLSHQLSHPSKGVEKEYEVVLEEKFNPDDLVKLIKGFHLPEGGVAKAERAWMIGDYKVGLVLKQGLKRQIRDMMYFLKNEVRRLVRVRIGNLSIKGLAEGQWRELSQEEVETLLLNPQAKDRPKLSRPRTAAVKRDAAKTKGPQGRKQDGVKGDAKAPASGKKRPFEASFGDARADDKDRPGRRSSSGRGRSDRGFGKRGPQERRSRKSW